MAGGPVQSTYLEQGGCQKVTIEFYYVELRTRLNLSGGLCRKPTKAVQKCGGYEIAWPQELGLRGMPHGGQVPTDRARN